MKLIARNLKKGLCEALSESLIYDKKFAYKMNLVFSRVVGDFVASKENRSSKRTNVTAYK